MIQKKELFFNDLINSHKGLHLTTYLPFNSSDSNNEDPSQFKYLLNHAISNFEDYLAPVMSKKEMNTFLKPIKNFKKQTDLNPPLKGNIGLFLSKDIFRIINFPFQIEYLSVVATTFHIKPILKLIQNDIEFALIGLTNDSCFLYSGDQAHIHLIDFCQFPVHLKSDLPENKMKWFKSWLQEKKLNDHAQLFIAGNTELEKAFVKIYKSDYLYPETISPIFNHDHAFEICQRIREILNQDNKNKIEIQLEMMKSAQNYNLTTTNIFQIAKNIIKGRVTKLFISEKINIFGKFDMQTGNLIIHPEHLDHEDDDLLDDLAQSLIKNGGEVILLPTEDLPKGRPIVALLNHPEDYKNSYFSPLLSPTA